jgi:exopolyphosphatase / guanosine-5'-triphosphate,3'-diphosphate pyrophosphatase
MTQEKSLESEGAVAVIDVGSNTIKLLVAELSSLGDLKVLHERSEATRIESELSTDGHILTANGMDTGLKAIERLVKESLSHEPLHVRIVATGIVRDSINGKLFAEKVRDSTGYELDIISGDEEAVGIALGVGTDSALSNRSNYLVCDLGGGSLELICVENRIVRGTVSLPLGAVRLAKCFVGNTSEPSVKSEMNAISAHVNETLSSTGFQVPLSPFCMVATGGAFTTARAVLAEAKNIAFEENPVLAFSDLSGFLEEVASLAINQRVERFHPLPIERADITPTGLIVILTLLEYFNVSEVHHSLRNLRFGLAAKLLDFPN